MLGERGIGGVVGKIELHLDVAMLLQECRQHRNELVQADDDRARDLQDSLRRAAIFAGDQFRLRNVGEDAHAALVERLTRIGQRNAARGAIEQSHAQPLLEPIDPTAHCRTRDFERLCGRREAGVINDGGEDTDLILTAHEPILHC